MNQNQEIAYWAKVKHSKEYFNAESREELKAVEKKIEAEEWVPVELIEQNHRTSLVRILKGDREGFREIVPNQFLVSEQ